jgi:hypothetical protein
VIQAEGFYVYNMHNIVEKHFCISIAPGSLVNYNYNIRHLLLNYAKLELWVADNDIRIQSLYSENRGCDLLRGMQIFYLRVKSSSLHRFLLLNKCYKINITIYIVLIHQQELGQDESSMEMDREEDEEDNGINCNYLCCIQTFAW